MMGDCHVYAVIQGCTPRPAPALGKMAAPTPKIFKTALPRASLFLCTNLKRFVYFLYFVLKKGDGNFYFG